MGVTALSLWHSSWLSPPLVHGGFEEHLNEGKVLMRILITLVVCICGMTNLSNAQTQGDECFDAINAYVGINPFETTNATSSSPTPDDTMCSGTSLEWGTSNPDIWFKFVPSSTDTYLFTTCNPDSFDTSMVLYLGTCDEAQQIACNGDGPSSKSCQLYHSELEHSLVSGQEYYVRIGGWQGDSGLGTLGIDSVGGGSDPNIWYVNESNSAPGNGTSWSSAFLDLQDALDASTSGDQIWMAQGTYTPSETGGLNDPREAAYRLIAGVEIYGGFQGYETNLSDRDPSTYVVVLSGDLGQDDSSGGSTDENAYHVVIADNLFGVSPLVDGVTISSGNSEDDGGGLFIRNYDAASTAFPILKQCNIVNNNAKWGGAVNVESGGVNLLLCKIIMNNATVNGAALFNRGDMVIDNCLISANVATGLGGALYSSGNVVRIINCTIAQNNAYFTGGVHFSSGANILTNNILWSNNDHFGDNRQMHLSGGTFNFNYNCIQNINSNLPGTGNISAAPRFFNMLGADGLPATGDENFRLMQLSPCIDAGDNTAVTTTIDLFGDTRQIDDPYMEDTGNNPSEFPVVDIGASEHVPGFSRVAIWSGATSELFNDYLNWLPNGVPTGKDSALFNTTDTELINVTESRYLNSIYVTSGDIVIDIANTTLQLLSQTDPLRVTPFDEETSLKFKGANGILKVDAGLRLYNANISFVGGATFEAPDLWISEGSVFNLDGIFTGNLTNNGSRVVPAGRDIGSLFIDGNMFHQNQDNEVPALVGVLSFDIGGRDQGEFDTLHVGGFADMTSVIELRWNNSYQPTSGDTYDLMTVGTAGGEPSLVYCSGLPSDLVCRWFTPNGLRGGSEVLVETTGPILFDSGTSTAVSTTPYDIVVADLDGINGSDVAMTLTDATGGAGTVVVMFNNGMSGGIWQGFTASSPITVGIDPRDIKVGDLNGDGTADDLVIANYGDDNVSVLENDGSGTFTKTDVSTDTEPLYIAIGNYYEDGLALDDIVVACESFNATVLKNTTSLGARGMTFTNIGSINIPFPSDINPGDVNNDKDLDFIVLDGPSEEVLVLEGNGFGSTPLGVVVGNPLPNGSDPYELEFEDLNLDGIDDAIIVNEGGGTMSVLLGDGNDLGSASTFSVGTNPQSMTPHDFDNDGDIDFVVSVIGDTSMERELLVIRNDSSGTIVLSGGEITGSGSEPILVEHGDFDEDGLEDLASIIDLAPSARGQNSPALSIFFNVTATVSACMGDVNSDDTVDITDLLAIISAWGGNDPLYDLDESGVVDVADILIVVGNWGACL